MPIGPHTLVTSANKGHPNLPVSLPHARPDNTFAWVFLEENNIRRELSERRISSGRRWPPPSDLRQVAHSRLVPASAKTESLSLLSNFTFPNKLVTVLGILADGLPHNLFFLTVIDARYIQGGS